MHTFFVLFFCITPTILFPSYFHNSVTQNNYQSNKLHHWLLKRHRWCRWDSNPGHRMKAQTYALDYGQLHLINIRLWSQILDTFTVSNDFLRKHNLKSKGGSPGLVVMGGESRFFKKNFKSKSTRLLD